VAARWLIKKVATRGMRGSYILKPLYRFAADRGRKVCDGDRSILVLRGSVDFVRRWQSADASNRTLREAPEWTRSDCAHARRADVLLASSLLLLVSVAFTSRHIVIFCGVGMSLGVLTVEFRSLQNVYRLL